MQDQINFHVGDKIKAKTKQKGGWGRIMQIGPDTVDWGPYTMQSIKPNEACVRWFNERDDGKYPQDIIVSLEGYKKKEN